jgi:hypothetical protein
VSGNPVTDQYLAILRDARAKLPPKRCDEHADCVAHSAGLIVEGLRAALPDLDPAVIGEVALHIGAILGVVYSDRRKVSSPAAAATYSINILGMAGARLYTEATGQET